MGTGELNAGGKRAMDQATIQGGVNTPSRFMLQKPKTRAGLMSWHLTRMQTLTYGCIYVQTTYSRPT